MKKAHWGMALCVTAGVLTASAADMYALRDEQPETGSNIYRTLLTWPVPIDARYEELNAQQKAIVRADYVTLSADDEPPYPAYGMTGVLKEIGNLRRAWVDGGTIHVAIRVDANGNPVGSAVLKAPDVKVAKAVIFPLMHTKYKPAKCHGVPCEADYSFRVSMMQRNPQQFIVDWNPVLWAERKIPGM